MDVRDLIVFSREGVEGQSYEQYCTGEVLVDEKVQDTRIDDQEEKNME